MDDSLDSQGDQSPEDDSQNTTAHSGSHEADWYKHLFALQGNMCVGFLTHTFPCPSSVFQCFGCLEEVAGVLEWVDGFLLDERRSSQRGDQQDEELGGTEE